MSTRKLEIARRRGPQACGCDGDDRCPAHEGRRAIEAIRASWPCQSCKGRRYHVTLRGRHNSCAPCQSTGIDLQAIEKELLRRSPD